MKLFIVFLGLLTSISSYAEYPPSQATVDKTIKSALDLDVGKLAETTKNLKWSCRFATSQEGEGKGKKEEEATANLQLTCIKNQCEALIGKMDQAMDKLLNMAEDESRDLLEFSGKSSGEIIEIMAKRNKDLPYTRMNCENSEAFRTMVFDSCFTLPTQCKKKGFL